MKKIILATALFILVNAGCKTSTPNIQSNTLDVTFEAKSESTVSGEGTFSEKKGLVTFTASFKGLKPGIHAIHIHEKADCSTEDASSAGGHWNPTFNKHGKLGVGKVHKGDIGNFKTDDLGNGTVSITTSEWCIGCGDTTKDVLGKSLIVHQGPDDYVTQPSGNSGARVACSAIIR